MKLYSNRSGYLYHVQSDYDCYIPNSISKVKINYDTELINLLTEAKMQIGRLNTVGDYLPDKDVFLAMYVQKESVVSSQIEGTQASLSDVLLRNMDNKKGVEEVVNYVKALNKGIELLNSLPISIRYMKELHKILLSGIRGENKNPGELRTSQNWIGPAGSTLKNASFIPPSPDKMKECLYELENDMHKEDDKDPLIKIALIHYQFETIHPFLDGNGRLGRLFIPLYLISHKVLASPLIYLSLYFKQNRNEYYSLLMDVRMKGCYENWIKFFLEGFIYIADNSVNTIYQLKNLDIRIKNAISQLKVKNKPLLFKTLSYLYAKPYFRSADLVRDLMISKPTAGSVIKTFADLNLITSTDNKQRNSTYRFNEYVDILEEGTEY